MKDYSASEARRQKRISILNVTSGSKRFVLGECLLTQVFFMFIYNLSTWKRRCLRTS